MKSGIVLQFCKSLMSGLVTLASHTYSCIQLLQCVGLVEVYE